MAITSINGPATVGIRKGSSTNKAIRNPQYDKDGNIISSGSAPGKKDISGGTNNPAGRTNVRKGRRNNVIQQAAKMSRRDPKQNVSLTAEELRKTALRRLRGE